MAFASGVGKQVIISKESSWGVKPAAGTGQYIRRVTCDLNLEREQFSSKEIVSTAQTTDSRSGTDNVTGKLSGEMSPGSYDMFWESLLRGAFTNGASVTATTISFVASTKKINRSAGSWITDGIKLGDIVKVTGSVNNNVRATVTAITATDLTVNAVLVNESSGASITVAVAGKKLSTPLLPSSRTDDSYTVEQYHSDVGVSRVATGVKINNASVKIDPDAIATVEFGMMGKDMTSSASPYFTTPAAASVTGVLTGNAGELYIDGVQAAVVTTFSFDLDGNMEAGKIVGNLLPDGTRPAANIFIGRIAAKGEFSAYFNDDTLFTKFRDEVPVTLVFRFNGEGTQAFSVKFPKCKLGGSTLDDKEVGGLIQSIPFTALLPDGSSNVLEQSTVVMQSITA